MKPLWKIILVVSLLGNLGAFYVFPKYEGYKGNYDYFTVRYDSLLQDFSDRATYAEQNQKLAAKTPGVPRVVMIGSEFILNWDLASAFPDLEVINRAIDEQRVAGMLGRFQPDVISLDPDIVIIGVSAYNFRPWSSTREIGDYVATMTDLARLNGIKPILVNTTPPTEICWIEDHNNWIVKDSLAVFNARLKEFADKESVPCLDFHSLVSDDQGFLKADYAANQTDLNAEGYARVNRLLAKYLVGDMIKVEK